MYAKMSRWPWKWYVEYTNDEESILRENQCEWRVPGRNWGKQANDKKQKQQNWQWNEEQTVEEPGALSKKVEKVMVRMKSLSMMSPVWYSTTRTPSMLTTMTTGSAPICVQSLVLEYFCGKIRRWSFAFDRCFWHDYCDWHQQMSLSNNKRQNSEDSESDRTLMTQRVSR